MIPTHYVGKSMNLAFKADQGSRKVTVELDGIPTTLSVDSAKNALEKFRNAIKYATA